MAAICVNASVVRESLVGGSAGFHVAIAPNTAVVQVVGIGSVLDTAHLNRLADISASMRAILARHEVSILLQAQQAAACNAAHPLQARLATWLLRCRDLAGADRLDLTQEYVATMLGVRRTSVSLTDAPGAFAFNKCDKNARADQHTEQIEGGQSEPGCGDQSGPADNAAVEQATHHPARHAGSSVRPICGRGVTEEFWLKDMRLPRDLPLSLSSQLVEQRPDVRAAEANLYAATAAIGVAIASRLPLFNLYGNVGLMSSQFKYLGLTPQTLFWTLAANVTQTIFDGFTLEQRQRAAEAGWDQATEQYRTVVVNAFQNVADALRGAGKGRA
jgi:hypothetical protein